MPPRSSGRTTPGVLGSPFLTQVALREDRVSPGVHPFTLPILQAGLSLNLTTPVTFFVGENGSGKSSLIEALAWACGFGMHGGSRDHQFAEASEGHALGRALSPQRQLAFLRIMHALASQRVAQFIVATHSPILLSLPGATVLSFDGGAIEATDYRETEHYRLTRDFLNAPERYLRHLLAEDASLDGDDVQ